MVLPELQFGSTKEAFEVIRLYIETKAVGKGPTLFNLMKPSNTEVYHALAFMMPNYFSGCNVAAVRLGKGDRKLSSIHGYSSSLLMYWTNAKAVEFSFAEFDGTQVDMRHILGDKYPMIRYMQLLLINDDTFPVTATVDSLSSPTTPENAIQVDIGTPRLSAIPEENPSEVSSLSDTALFAVFGKVDETSKVELTHALEALNEEPVDVEPKINLENVKSRGPTQLNEVDDLGYPCVQLFIDDTLACNKFKLEIPDGHEAVMNIYATTVKTAVIKRDTDILTKDEEHTHWKELQEAMLEELKIWVKYDCFRMRLKHGVRNLMDSRNVNKWKWINENGTKKRIIRVRMALRGFKDRDADTLETYAGTAGRTSQRLLTSEAANHPSWEFLTIDVNKAFLQGATYQELEMLTGEAPREVCFTLPKGMSELIRKIPGYETYDEKIHCLECNKPGTGSKDAPRAFSIKLATVTRSSKVGLKPTTFDPELEVKHQYVDGYPRLVLMIAKHVDDIKVTGEPYEVNLLMNELEQVFGKLTVTRNEFTNCGVHHKRHSDGSITLDQDEYIKALIPIKHKDLSLSPSTPASDELLSLYRSLLGAVAYTQLTQHQMACYIVALQRRTHKLTIEDIKKLNVVTKKIKQKPVTLTFRNLGLDDNYEHLTVFSDAGFKKEEIDGYALRGALYVRHKSPLYNTDGTPVSQDQSCHVLLAESRSIKTVCRSTYAAELMSATSATDMIIPLTVTLCELKSGPLGADRLRKIRDDGWCDYSMIHSSILIDAKSVFESLKATIFKPPVENSLSGHVLWLREMHSKGLINDIVWTDTRDMYADGLTKGVIKRDALYELMSGIVRLRHAVDSCTRRHRKALNDLD